jgi:hypothetical protein
MGCGALKQGQLAPFGPDSDQSSGGTQADSVGLYQYQHDLQVGGHCPD